MVIEILLPVEPTIAADDPTVRIRNHAATTTVAIRFLSQTERRGTSLSTWAVTLFHAS